MKHTTISWTDHTFNPWWGCEKVSPACTHCYAEREAVRFGHPVWGKAAPRRRFGVKHWMEPHRWDIEAKREGVRRRVFCASMADVFEARRDLDEDRRKLWELIDTTSGLDWLLLTKRPENIRTTVPEDWIRNPRKNVWWGTTAENQECADRRLPELLDIPGVVHFVSAEPLLGPIDLGEYLPGERWFRSEHPMGKPLSWVIAGGESGPHARAADPAWYRELRDQTIAAGVPFHFKQWGEWGPHPELAHIVRIGKKAAGRELDGRTWDQFPETGKETR